MVFGVLNAAETLQAGLVDVPDDELDAKSSRREYIYAPIMTEMHRSDTLGGFCELFRLPSERDGAGWLLHQPDNSDLYSRRAPQFSPDTYIRSLFYSPCSSKQ